MDMTAYNQPEEHDVLIHAPTSTHASNLLHTSNTELIPFPNIPPTAYQWGDVLLKAGTNHDETDGEHPNRGPRFTGSCLHDVLCSESPAHEKVHISLVNGQ
jgi:hypothetical protein